MIYFTDLKATFVEIARENVGVDIAESKIISGGYLASIIFRSDDAPVNVQLEMSLREGEKRGEAITVVSDFIPAYTVLVSSQRPTH